VDARTVKKAELLGLKLMKASEMIQNEAQTLFKRHGLSAPQYNVLRILRGAGGEGLSCREISGRMITRVPDITRLLDRLQDKGLVERRRLESDRRVVMTEATPRGLALLQDIDRPLDQQVRDHFRSLGPADLDRLDGLMDVLLAGLKRD
jgi:DNA-binding MarR family transcriptional regulator